MRSRTFTASASALLFFVVSLVEATAHNEHVHSHLQALHKQHRAHRDLFDTISDLGESEIEVRSEVVENVSSEDIEKRGGQCTFPTNLGLVPVTLDQQNAGWAMSPNQPCLPGNYCPYACPSGQVSMQWDPSVTSYTYPGSMNGGLYCDNNGNVNKPFPNNPYCQPGTGAATVTNNAGSVVSFCQTVLPGNEAMLIPTSIEQWAQLAVPDTSYWAETAAHYYINPPGVTTDEACIWGSSSSPTGNWAPYVAGANTDANGNTFVKLGWNPIYLQATTPFRNTMPTWGVEITCSGGNCNGLPCAIDPSKNSVNEMVGSSTDGAGGGAFCVVTVPNGATANFEVFQGSAGSSSSSAATPSTAPSSTYVAPSSSSAAPSSSASSWSAWTQAGAGFYAANSTSSTSAASSSSSAWPSASAASHMPSSIENGTSTYAASAAALTPTSSEAIATPSDVQAKSAGSVVRFTVAGIALSVLAASIATMA